MQSPCKVTHVNETRKYSLCINDNPHAMVHYKSNTHTHTQEIEGKYIWGRAFSDRSSCSNMLNLFSLDIEHD